MDTQAESRGLALTTTGARAAPLVAQALDCILEGSGGAMGLLESALAEDPQFAFAHLLVSISHLDAGRPELAANHRRLARELSAHASPREHAAIALCADFADGDRLRALARTSEHLADFPRDAIVLDQALGFVFFDGGPGKKARALELLDSVARVYGDDWFFQARRAFHLQEAGRLDEAERAAERALLKRPTNVGAAHAQVHILYARDDRAGALDFVRAWVEKPNAGKLAGHLWWHLALLELEEGRVQEALGIYEKHLVPAAASGPRGLVLADAVGLLVRVGEPPARALWPAVATFAKFLAQKPGRPFSDVHASIALAMAERAVELRWLHRGVQSQGEAVRGFVAAMSALGADDPVRAARGLSALGPAELEALGGSNIERELRDELLYALLMRLGLMERAQEIASERLVRVRSPRSQAMVEQAGRKP